MEDCNQKLDNILEVLEYFCSGGDLWLFDLESSTSPCLINKNTIQYNNAGNVWIVTEDGVSIPIGGNSGNFASANLTANDSRVHTFKDKDLTINGNEFTFNSSFSAFSNLIGSLTLGRDLFKFLLDDTNALDSTMLYGTPATLEINVVKSNTGNGSYVNINNSLILLRSTGNTGSNGTIFLSARNLQIGENANTINKISGNVVLDTIENLSGNDIEPHVLVITSPGDVIGSNIVKRLALNSLPNFGSTNIVFTADRIHDANGHGLQITGLTNLVFASQDGSFNFSFDNNGVNVLSKEVSFSADQILSLFSRQDLNLQSKKIKLVASNEDGNYSINNVRDGEVKYTLGLNSSDNLVKNISPSYGSILLTFDGTQSVFAIPHGLGVEPKSISLTFENPRITNLSVDSFRTKDETNIYIICDVAPSPGTTTVYWQAYP